jgi:hypothetical protein
LGAAGAGRGRKAAAAGKRSERNTHEQLARGEPMVCANIWRS